MSHGFLHWVLDYYVIIRLLCSYYLHKEVLQFVMFVGSLVGLFVA